MPDPIRKNYQEPSGRQLFEACPTGLAWLGPDGTVQLNQAALQTLQELVSVQESACFRWTAGAVSRLQAGDRCHEILPGILDRQRSLEVRLATGLGAGWQLMTIQESLTSGSSAGDLTETVSTLSHELRTPLASMKSSLNLVLTGEAGSLNSDQRRFLDMTLRNINRLDRLVGDLLDVSQADAGQMNLRPSWLDLDEVVAETVESHRQAAAAAGLALRFTGTGLILAVSLDEDKLVQMLGNLLSNALKYTPSGGLVAVSLEVPPKQDQLRIEVRDTGPGMDPEVLKRALQPFQRSQSATQSLVPGAGLGLHITKRLVEAQGGRLGLESQVGRGTLAWIELPLDQSQMSGKSQPIPELVEI